MSSTDFPDIPGFKIKSILGIGGTSTVYLAYQAQLDRDIALKVMDSKFSHDPGFRSRFLREIRSTAKVSEHPNIVSIYDVGQTNTNDYIAMQYMPGPSLKERLDIGKAPDLPITLTMRVAAALEYVHSRGLIHRDIKPGNILFDERDQALLSDFGIAKNLMAETSMTQVGSVLGTARYMSPEQASADQNVDPRSDLYSLGVVLLEMISGSAGRKSVNRLQASDEPVDWQSTRLPERYQSLRPIINKLLALEPADRYQKASELIADLSLCQASETGPELIQEPSSTRDRRPGPLIWACLSLASLAATLTYLINDTSVSTPDNECETISEAQASKVARLVDMARIHASVGRIDFPAGANAVDSYRKALEISPCDQAISRELNQLNP